MATVLEAARQVYRAGLCLLPVQEDGSKKPDLPSWLEFKTRRPTPKEIKTWDFGRRHGLGVIAGPVSGSSECWDFDHFETYTAFVAAAVTCGLGDVVERIRRGYEDETPHGGRRWIVRYPETVTWKDTTLAARPMLDGTTKVLIELPTFSIIAPSHGPVHPTGRPYVRVSGEVATIAAYTVEERDALLTLARSFDERPKKAAHEPRTTTGTSRRPGDLYNERATWPEVIGAYFHSPRTLSSGVTYWWRPGKEPGTGSHAATTNHGGSDLLYIFSSSTVFAVDTSYSKFAAYALLEHGGDFSAAGKALWTAGYRDLETESSSAASSTTRLATDQTWPTPLGEAAYYGLFGRIVRKVQPHTESDPAALLLQLLVMLGNIIGRTAHFTVEADTHYLNEFLGLVGQTSKARKGTSYGYGNKLFRSLDPTWIQTSGLSSGEGLIWAVRDPILKIHKGDPVVEDPGVTDKRLLVFESELASTLHVMERAGNILADVMKDAWDSRPLSTLTKNSPARATEAHISVIAHITVDELRRYLTRTEMANGWGNRFLVACVKRAQLLPLGGQAVDLVTEFRQELEAVIASATRTGPMGFEAEAEALWRMRYERLSADRPGLLGSMTARAEAHTRRLACLVALTDQSGIVTRSHLEAALAIWRYAFDSVAYVFGDSLGDPIADTLMRALKTAPDGLTRTEISNLLGRHQSAEAISQALTLLVTLQLVGCIEEKTGGRPVERWRILPRE